MTRWTILAFGILICLYASPALAIEEELITGLHSDEGDLDQISAIMGKDMSRYYSKRRHLLRDEPHAYAKFLHRRYAARTVTGVVITTVIAPAAIGGTVLLGLMWRDVNNANDSSDEGSGMPNFALGFASLIVPPATILCGVVAAAAIAGGVSLWAFNARKARALRNLVKQHEEGSSYPEEEKISVSVVPFVDPAGSAGLGLVGSF